MTSALRSRAAGLLLLLAVAALAAIPLSVAAHEGREIGEYEVEVGFLNEPAYEGEPNAAFIEIAHHDDGEPVSGVASRLTVEVTHVPTGTSRTFEMQEAADTPGQYAADFIPTAPGAYQFRFTGDIDGTAVDETFLSGPGTFSEIESAREVQFPVQLGSSRELEGAVRGVQTTAQSAEDSASTARSLGIVGVVLGAFGLGAGAFSLAMQVRKRRDAAK